MPGVFGHIGCGTAIFAAKRKALQQAERDQQDRRDPADLRVGRQQADRECREAHDHDGDEEGVFAADKVAEPSEDQGAEWPNQEARGIGRKS